MAKISKGSPVTTEDLTPTEETGELEEQKVFTNKKLGSFTFRLPYVFDELNVLRRRAQILGVPEENAGRELLALAHSQAMYEIYLIEAPRKFKIENLRSWADFLDLLALVQAWHQEFFRNMDGEEA
jgi:thioester reductase-like protein